MHCPIRSPRCGKPVTRLPFATHTFCLPTSPAAGDQRWSRYWYAACVAHCDQDSEHIRLTSVRHTMMGVQWACIRLCCPCSSCRWLREVAGMLERLHTAHVATFVMRRC